MNPVDVLAMPANIVATMIDVLDEQAEEIDNG